MIQRSVRLVILAAITLLAFLPTVEAAKYRYGRYRGGGQDQGFYVYIEGALANPRNVDNVVGTTDSGGTLNPIVPDWGDDPAYRLGFGYQWASGNKLEGSYWTFSSDVPATYSGPLYFSIGPPVPGVGDQSDPNGTLSVVTEVNATTSDLTWKRSAELADAFRMEWSVGLRWANFEETTVGQYGGLGGSTYAASKRNEGDMIGAKLGVRGSYRLAGNFSISSHLGFSMLDGKNSASSSLTPLGSTTPASSSTLTDDGRSGTIRDFDVAVNWHFSNDRGRVWFGWEQSAWERITSDLVRNFAGTSVPLRDRDGVTFSGYKLGLAYRF